MSMYSLCSLFFNAAVFEYRGILLPLAKLTVNRKAKDNPMEVVLSDTRTADLSRLRFRKILENIENDPIGRVFGRIDRILPFNLL